MSGEASVLFFGKQGDVFCGMAEKLVRTNFKNLQVHIGKRGEPFPEAAQEWQGDYVISYLSPWIIPEAVLQTAKVASINFHPGPPEYPGIGCTNFAIYNGEKQFGITCHHMAAKVDTGNIIAVKRFPLYPADSVLSLTQRCYGYILTTFYEVMQHVIEGTPLPQSEETWQRKPYKRKELNELCRVTLDMEQAEVERRIRATSFPNAPGAYLEYQGKRFIFEVDNSESVFN